MSFQSDMISDLDVFLADFGIPATYTPAGAAGSEITGIFDNEYIPANTGGIEVESYGPAFTCKDSDVSGAAHGDTLLISGTLYNIIGIKPDGTGFTVLILSRD